MDALPLKEPGSTYKNVKDLHIVSTGLSMSPKTATLKANELQEVQSVTLKISDPDNSDCKSIIHAVSLAADLSSKNKSVTLKQFPEFDLEGAHLVLPLHYEDVDFIVQRSSEEHFNIKITVIVRNTIKPHIFNGNEAHILDRAARLINVRSMTTIPSTPLRTGSRLEISFPQLVASNTAIEPLLISMEEHHRICAEEKAQEQAMSTAQSTALDQFDHEDKTPMTGISLLCLDDVDDLAEEKCSISNTATREHSPVFSPEQDPVTISPTLPSIDLTETDIEFLANRGLTTKIDRTLGHNNSVDSANLTRPSHQPSRGTFNGSHYRGCGGYRGHWTRGRGGQSGRQPSWGGPQKHYMARQGPPESGYHAFGSAPAGRQSRGNPYPVRSHPVNRRTSANPVIIDAERQQARVSKDSFWAQKAADTRWRTGNQTAVAVRAESPLPASSPTDVRY